MKIDSITNNQMIGVGIGTTVAGLGIGHINHKKYENNMNEFLQESLEETSQEYTKRFMEEENIIRERFVSKMNNTEELDEFVRNSGKKYIEEVPVEKMLTPNELKSFEQSKNLVLETFKNETEMLTNLIRNDIKANKVKSYGIYGAIGLALSAILPIIKHCKKKATNENTTNINIQK